MADILDFFAAAHTPYLHARGAAATTLLLDALAPQNGQCMLEIGFGTGQTFVEIEVRWPDVRLYGVEKSPQMLATSRRRFRFCGLNLKALQLFSGIGPLPYPTGFFDSVYCESVLAVMSAEILENTVAEVFRVLKPAGSFVFNESVWRDETAIETILTINRECRERFGIPQATEQFPYLKDWLNLCASKGFQPTEPVRLEKMPPILPVLPPVRRPTVSVKSQLFSVAGAIKSRCYPRLWRQRRDLRKNEQHFGQYGLFLEGVMFKMRKPRG